MPHTVGEDGFWKTFDWGPALAKGMASAGQPFSGEFAFVETQMLWPINHMVAPKEEALACVECHAKDGRLANIAGLYAPGANSNRLLDMAGFGLVLLTLAGVAGHGIARALFKIRRGRPS